MSAMFDGIDTETLRTLHRQIGAKAMAAFTDAAAAAADAALFGEIMDYARQLHATVCLIGTELQVRHAIYVAAAAERAAALAAAPARPVLCLYCNNEPATEGRYCGECAPAVHLATGE
jgi:hypothetical protein